MMDRWGLTLVLYLFSDGGWASAFLPTSAVVLHSFGRQSSLPLSNNPFSLSQVDVVYGSRASLQYDPLLERYVPVGSGKRSHGDFLNGETPPLEQQQQEESILPMRLAKSYVLPFLKQAFIPDSVTPSYYRFVKWRVIQRFLSSTVHVIGTQSLLLGLGLKSKNLLGVSAALNWVLKDALGKVVRLVWAARMGRKFDVDAKRWRFRSSLVFAVGNALEIITYMNPSLFLLWATLGNCCKQSSMLTSSSTRTAIYNSFRTAENIADITAKGEAQIAVVDLVGIAAGVWVAKAVGMKITNILIVYALLQGCEIFSLYRMISSVEFKVLNFERLQMLVDTYVTCQKNNEVVLLPTPSEMAKKERIFLPPKHLSRRALAFGSLGRAKLTPEELQELLSIFQNERFLLVVGGNVKQNRNLWSRRKTLPQENCHVVLHANATNVDIVKSTLALTLLRRSLSDETVPTTRSRDVYPEIRQACRECDAMFPQLLRLLSQQGWAPPARFMFGRVSMRAEWPLMPRTNSTTATMTRSEGSLS